jgi:hypothetical protein
LFNLGLTSIAILSSNAILDEYCEDTTRELALDQLILAAELQPFSTSVMLQGAFSLAKRVGTSRYNDDHGLHDSLKERLSSYYPNVGDCTLSIIAQAVVREHSACEMSACMLTRILGEEYAL